MWAQAVSTAIGLWLYVAPGVLGYDAPASASDRIVGAIVIAFSFVALWEFLRGVRLANRPLAVWLVISPLLFDYPTAAFVSTMASGVAIFALSFVEGEIEHSYGGGWRAVLRGGGDGDEAPLRSGEGRGG